MFLKIKKILLLLLILFSFLSLNNTNAADWEGWNIEIRISTNFSSVLPWTCAPANNDWDYICTVPKWVTWFQIIMWWLIKYITFITWLAWVLFIVVNWCFGISM